MCIRNMIEEIVRLKNGDHIRVPADRHRFVFRVRWTDIVMLTSSCSSRADKIRKVEPSEATLKALEEAAVFASRTFISMHYTTFYRTPHQPPPTPTSPNAVPIADGQVHISVILVAESAMLRSRAVCLTPSLAFSGEFG